MNAENDALERRVRDLLGHLDAMPAIEAVLPFTVVHLVDQLRVAVRALQSPSDQPGGPKPAGGHSSVMFPAPYEARTAIELPLPPAFGRFRRRLDLVSDRGERRGPLHQVGLVVVAGRQAGSHQ